MAKTSEKNYHKQTQFNYISKGKRSRVLIKKRKEKQGFDKKKNRHIDIRFRERKGLNESKWFMKNMTMGNMN